MLTSIKNAIEAVKRKEENIKTIQFTEKKLKKLEFTLHDNKEKIAQFRKEIDERDRHIILRENHLFSLEEIIEKKTLEYKTLSSKTRSLKNRIKKQEKDLFELRELAKRKDEYNHFNGCLYNNIDMDVDIKKKNVAYSKIYNVLSNLIVVRTNQRNKLNPHYKNPKDDIPKNILEDVELNSIVMKFVEKYSETYNLIIPTVLDSLVEYIGTGKINQFQWTNTTFRYSHARESMINFYKNHLSSFFLLLKKNGYLIQGNELVYLTLLKEKALHINFAKLDEEFFSMRKLTSELNSIEEVLHQYILVTGKDIRSFVHLGFLTEFLRRKGFGDYEEELLINDELLQEAEDNYKMRKLEKVLLEPEINKADKKTSIEYVDNMSGEEFERFLVKLLSKL